MSDWYKWYPDSFLVKTRGLTAAEIGVYATIINLIQLHGEPLLADYRYLGGTAGCSTRMARKLVKSLVEQRMLTVDGERIDAPVLREWAGRGGRQAIPGHIRDLVFERDGEVCRYCGDVAGPFHIDHIEPVAHGGSNDPENLTVACAPCNLSKGAKRLGEWLQ